MLTSNTCTNPIAIFKDVNIELDNHNVVISENRIRTDIHVELPTKSIRGKRREVILQAYLSNTCIKTDTIKWDRLYYTERPVRNMKINVPVNYIGVSSVDSLWFNIRLRDSNSNNYREGEKVPIAMVFKDSATFLLAKEQNRIWK